ncbi:MAG: hypothetical protein HC842_02335 [Cytophagales bacterium]|nr:hypothetical protein [Cytophagales bacterium]
MAFLGLWSCQEKLICPAYQSYYILDEKWRKELFTYVVGDSANALDEYIVDVRKDRYGLIPPATHLEKTLSLATIEMEMVYPYEDSLGDVENFEEEEPVFVSNPNNYPSDYIKFFNKVDTVPYWYTHDQKTYYYYVKDDLIPFTERAQASASKDNLTEELIGDEGLEETPEGTLEDAGDEGAWEDNEESQDMEEEPQEEPTEEGLGDN